MSSWFRQLKLLCMKDLLHVARTPAQIAAILVFVLLVTLVGSLAVRQIGITEGELQRIATALFWISNIFTAVLTLQYTALFEEEQHGSVGVLLTGVSTEVLFLSKWIVSWLLLFALQMLALLFCVVLLNLSLRGHGLEVLEICLLSSAGLAGVGVLLSAVSSALRSRDVVLPMLLLPLSLPLLSASVFLTHSLFEGESILRGGFWYLLLWCFTSLVIGLGMVLYDQVLR